MSVSTQSPDRTVDENHPGSSCVYQDREEGRTEMVTIRVPYPTDPEGRRDVFEQIVAKLTPFGKCEGTPDAGTLSGSTPIGEFAGSYRSEPGSDVLEIEVTKKPWLVPTSLIEHEVRKQMSKT